MKGLSSVLFDDPMCDALFGADMEIKTMLRVEAALAKVQGALGVIPPSAADVLSQHLPLMDISADELSAETARNGVPVPALLTAIRKRLPAGDSGQWLHWGATSQDIIDTSLVVRLQHLSQNLDTRLQLICRALGHLAQTHADLTMAGRSYGQIAAPTTFGALVASWGAPLLRYRTRLAGLSGDLFKISLGGAVGNLSAMGGQGALVRAALAAELGLVDPGANWHAERDGIAMFASWLSGVAGSLSKFAGDVILLAQTGIDEITIDGAGGSSTMPQKQNPVRASLIVALAQQSVALAAVVQGAASHHQNRDGAAWFTEWLALPALCSATSAALRHALELAREISPDPSAMRRNLHANGGMVFAEAISFGLSRSMPRPEAQALVKKWCAEAAKGGEDILQCAKRQVPALDWDAVLGALSTGDSSQQAQDFAARSLATI